MKHLTGHEVCPFCGHGWHYGEFCRGWSECDDDCGPHECACSHPDPMNHFEVPARKKPRA